MSNDGSKLEYLAPRAKPVSIEDKKGGYLPEPSDRMTLENNFYDEINKNNSRSWDKLSEGVKKNPFVPLGCLVTIGVLANGILAMRNKDRLKSQRMMRYRIAAQGSTIIALVIGTMASNYFAKSE
ncbi:HIG1 domain family member mitochondrial [Brachionus plicatilis]|uniref:HIG1 domain family member mitochondrial n=1 Tax=Brachionus plicatilis TaxID=10195 RepID=A0A3M7P2J6_BRAPC|nr:HIG1 domain family member mitochondrial [Brachionus plicatilis]